MNRVIHTSVLKTRGFTLIELLIVIAIIALIAAILFPVFARARENARRSACLSNMKQMGLALQQYTQDNDERMPIQTYALTYNFMASNAANGSGVATGATSNYLAVLFPYTKSSAIFVCPSSTPNVNQAGCTTDCIAPTAISKTSYFGNAVVILNQYDHNGNDIGLGIKARHIAMFSKPAELIFAQEALGSYNAALMYPRLERNGGVVRYHRWHQYSSGQESFSNRHFDGGNLIFVDGHAKWRKYTTLKASDFGLRNCNSGSSDVWNTTTPTDCETDPNAF